LALLSKEQALTLPLLAVMYEYGYRDDRAETTNVTKLRRCGLLWLLAGTYLVIRIGVMGTFAPVSRFRNFTWYDTVLTGTGLVARYIGKLLWPVHLSIFYTVHQASSLWSIHFLEGLGAFLFSVWLFYELWNRKRPASFGLLWFFVTLTPVLNVHWLATNVLAERYLYLPSVGFCWVAASGWTRLWAAMARDGTVRRRVLAAAGMSVLALFAVRIIARNMDWRDEVILFSRTVATAPQSVPLRLNLGAAYWREGNVDAAEREFREVLTQDPHNSRALGALGIMYAHQGRYPAAVDALRRAIKEAPRMPGLHVSLGAAYLDMGLLDNAELEFNFALTLAPMEVRAYGGLGTVYWRRGDLLRAEETFKRALAISPSSSEVRNALGAFYDANGRPLDALQEYQSVLKIDPNNVEARAATRRLIP